MDLSIERNRIKIFNKYRGNCAYCAEMLTLASMEIDHLIPKSSISFKRVQLNDEVNLMPSCHECNKLKNDYDIETFRYKILLNELRSKKYLNFRKNGGKFYFEVLVITKIKENVKNDFGRQFRQ